MTTRDTPAVKDHRLGIPFSIGAVALVGIVIILLMPELDRNFEVWLVAIVVALALLLELVWFLLLSRFKWQLRMATFGVFVLLIFCVTWMVRVDGTANGTGLPKLAWRWTVKPAQFSSASPLVSVAEKSTSECGTGFHA